MSKANAQSPAFNLVAAVCVDGSLCGRLDLAVTARKPLPVQKLVGIRLSLPARQFAVR